MALIQVSVIEDVLTPEQKRRIVEKLTAAKLEVTGEAMRRTWATIQDVPGGDGGIGGRALATADAHALAPTDPRPEPSDDPSLRHSDVSASGESRMNRHLRLVLSAALVLVASGCGVVNGNPMPGHNRGAARSQWHSPDRGIDRAGRLAVDGSAAAIATAA